ncbi:hypothetical protein RhiirA5_496910 [Rhizophagus irregularis]|uniref:Uncharacterized protein n=3 Tax=Rhizophagus irregularis TaxID=588596 RepID=U9TRU8_RHIID|nr:hypothetical protein GLOIN_2v1476286 [Rhizophagus irregularis DAOM 181602=DAOM 197198]EXX75110.1 hypothetical protein RirG_044690 [Rhizophagus irregularis DAOM 197198w]PKC12498.1 hypothetical protein RhiirA5_496910 [Rhizophagus irregularis]PKC68405.1 hypothetical protein RhiirA1_534230 [Rhizophagus irregularis]PKY19955.1 hypothetical protein RhiirB3_469479 [Rhizophagus irregularis]POG74297.1 hypothetical protein GLOIN_2v1476286 [Rhizophagus irregularis DAOM 181602=DAOM 197198]|eukprot:XP_025181163.1 hypothetical protein GLOIN_2v1476286 [Rhizophagus irregularis DAOM 181602=DAOM 197198]
MNSLEKFFQILYNYDMAKEENRRKGKAFPVKSPRLTMSFDFPDVDPPIVNAPHEILFDMEETPNLHDNNNDEMQNRSRSHSISSSPNNSIISISSDDVMSEDVKMTDASIDGGLTSESDSNTSPTTRTCHHPKHRIYKRRGLTTNSFVKITKNLASIVGIDDNLIICRGCMKQSHQDKEYTSHQDYIAPKKAKKEHMLNNLKIEMVGFNQRGKRVTRSHKRQ